MVTRQGKDLLKNTIQSVGFHNKVLEEQEMWKQWELERGLTMMVSDDHIRERMAVRKAQEQVRSNSALHKDRICDRRSSREKGSSRKRHRSPRSLASNGPAVAKTTVAPEDRWDHSGFYELEYGSATYEQRKSDNQRACSTSSESSRSISQPMQYGPRPPPALHVNQQRGLFKNRRRKEKRRSPIPSSSTTSTYQSDDMGRNNSTDSELSSSSSEDSARSPKRRRYGKSRGDRRGRSPTRRRPECRGETYGQCLKIRQANNRWAEKRIERRSTTYSSSSSSSSSETESTTQSGSENDTSAELSNSDDSCSSMESDKHSSRRGRSHHLDHQRRYNSPKHGGRHRGEATGNAVKKKK